MIHHAYILYILFYSSIHVLNVSQITQNDDNPGVQVFNAKRNNFTDKPHVKKKDLKIKVS